MDIGPVDYAKAPPAAYMCSNCGVTGCKLWRQYQTFAEHIKLLCGPCALVDQKEDGVIDARGFKTGSHGRPSDSIGWLVPAVPTEDGNTFWGYTSVPQSGVDWWRALPLESTGVEP